MMCEPVKRRGELKLANSIGALDTDTDTRGNLHDELRGPFLLSLSPCFCQPCLEESTAQEIRLDFNELKKHKSESCGIHLL